MEQKAEMGASQFASQGFLLFDQVLIATTITCGHQTPISLALRQGFNTSNTLGRFGLHPQSGAAQSLSLLLRLPAEQLWDAPESRCCALRLLIQ